MQYFNILKVLQNYSSKNINNIFFKQVSIQFWMLSLKNGTLMFENLYRLLEFSDQFDVHGK